MKERIKEKLNEHVERILSKEVLDTEDILFLKSELVNIEMREKEEEDKVALEKHKEVLTSLMQATF